LKNIQPITVDEYLALLRAKGSGVMLDLASMPGPPNEYSAFRADLDSGDEDRVFLWFEFHKHTANGSCKLRGCSKCGHLFSMTPT
jgi:hypothetical protein